MRFVASTLLDAVRKADSAPASAARAHAYLCEPITSLNVISPSELYSRGLFVNPFRDRKELHVSSFSGIRCKLIHSVGRLEDDPTQIDDGVGAM